MVGNARELHPDIAWPVPPKTDWRIQPTSTMTPVRSQGPTGASAVPLDPFRHFPKFRLHADITVTRLELGWSACNLAEVVDLSRPPTETQRYWVTSGSLKADKNRLYSSESGASEIQSVPFFFSCKHAEIKLFPD